MHMHIKEDMFNEQNCWVKSSGRTTQFTQSSEKISVKTKLRAKLYSFHDRTIHVRGGIYRTLVFVFYIK
jgi:hypothetical protein